MPVAEMQELLPAGRLLSRAARVTPLQYEQAKAAFLGQVSQAGLAAQVLAARLLPRCLLSPRRGAFGRKQTCL